MARTGPLTKDSTTVAIGLMQIRVGSCETYIGQIAPILAASASIGALADTKYMGNADFYHLESGYPMLEDAVFALRESAHIECSFKEITPFNFALAQGLDPSGGGYADAHKGVIGLGGLSAPLSVRVEAVYTYPDGTNTMTIIFPRAQVAAVQEMDMASEEPTTVALTFEAKRADSDSSWENSSGSTVNGHTIWDTYPLGRILWDDGTVTTTSTTTTTTGP